MFCQRNRCWQKGAVVTSPQQISISPNWPVYPEVLPISYFQGLGLTWLVSLSIIDTPSMFVVTINLAALSVTEISWERSRGSSQDRVPMALPPAIMADFKRQLAASVHGGRSAPECSHPQTSSSNKCVINCN